MLYTETIDTTTLALLTRIMEDETMQSFILAGGTALSLRIGHRISIDLDLFTGESFNESLLADHLRTYYQFKLDFIAKNTLKGEITGIQIDCIAHQYPWLEEPAKSEGNIRLAGFSDIAAMKLNAIAGNGTRIKDFIDIAFLSGKLSFNEMLESYETKYNSNPVVPLKAIIYFNDINFNEPIKMANKNMFDWSKIATRLINMQKFPDRLFSVLPI